jgi:DNA-binding NarL/FixJ family response regulator
VLSAHVEVEHAMDLLASGNGIGYLLSAIDPTLVRELVGARRADDPLSVLTTREREVLGLMAEGRSNVGIAHRLWITEGTVEKHVRSILAKLDLHETVEDHRRVLAVVTFLDAH